MSFTDRSLGCFLVQLPAGCQGKIANRIGTSIFLPQTPLAIVVRFRLLTSRPESGLPKSVKLQFTLYAHTKTRTAPDNA